MLKVLVPVDGSAQSARAVDHLLKLRGTEGEMEVHLLNVQIPVDSGHARMFVSAQDIEAYHREEGEAALKAARERLDRAGVGYTHHIVVGHVAETIARFAEERRFDKIVMGTHGRSALTHLLLGSVATDVLRASDIPVTLVK